MIRAGPSSGLLWTAATHCMSNAVLPKPAGAHTNTTPALRACSNVLRTKRTLSTSSARAPRDTISFDSPLSLPIALPFLTHRAMLHTLLRRQSGVIGIPRGFWAFVSLALARAYIDIQHPRNAFHLRRCFSHPHSMVLNGLSVR